MEHYVDLDQLDSETKGSVDEYSVAYIKDLLDLVPVGVGIDRQEAREDYIEKLENLISKLDKARVETMYELDNLIYIDRGGDNGKID